MAVLNEKRNNTNLGKSSPEKKASIEETSKQNISKNSITNKDKKNEEFEYDEYYDEEEDGTNTKTEAAL